MKILAVGPFVGDIEYELTNFQPYVKWLSQSLECNEIYISTHFNRMFLYDWIKEENKFPIDDMLSRDEIGQKRAIHGSVKQKDLQTLTKDFKTFITERHNCKPKEIEYFNLSYIASQFQIPFYNKIFESFPLGNVNIENSLKNRIVFMPQKRMGETVAEKILEKLNMLDANPLIIGDLKTYFPEQNELLKNTDYFYNVYQKMRNVIAESKCVIGPNGYLPVIANLDRKPIFTWGSSPGQYKLERYV